MKNVTLTSTLRAREQRWDDAMRHCERELSKEDFALIVKCTSPDKLLAAVDTLIQKTKHNSVPQMLRQLKPHLGQIQTFVLGALATATLPVVESVCIWGLITLVLQVN